jgi:hypothetical protein
MTELFSSQLTKRAAHTPMPDQKRNFLLHLAFSDLYAGQPCKVLVAFNVF